MKLEQMIPKKYYPALAGNHSEKSQKEIAGDGIHCYPGLKYPRTRKNRIIIVV